MRLFRREPTTDPTTLQRGERVLARTTAEDGTVLAATRDALHLGALHLGSVSADAPSRRIDWEQVETADWDGVTATFRVTEVGRWGEERPIHEFVLDDARVFLELVHDRVTASIVIQRHVTVPNGSVRVIARRAPHGESRILWLYEYDEGVDPDDPRVQAAAEQALAQAKADVGLV